MFCFNTVGFEDLFLYQNNKKKFKSITVTKINSSAKKKSPLHTSALRSCHTRGMQISSARHKLILGHIKEIRNDTNPNRAQIWTQICLNSLRPASNCITSSPSLGKYGGRTISNGPAVGTCCFCAARA